MSRITRVAALETKQADEQGTGSGMHFEIIGEIENIETIATGGRIRDIMRLHKEYGSGKWRKLKGFAKVRLRSGSVRKAEVHWYEAHSIGRKKVKIKRLLD